MRRRSGTGRPTRRASPRMRRGVGIPTVYAVFGPGPNRSTKSGRPPAASPRRGNSSVRPSSRGQEAVPVGLPTTALLQRFDRHQRLGVVTVPAHAPALDPLPGRLAHRLRRPAAYLPAHLGELLVAD